MTDKRVIFICGKPNSGKTTLSFLLQNSFPDKVNIIFLDKITRKWLIKKNICKEKNKFNIQAHISENRKSPYLDGNMFLDIYNEVKRQIEISNLEIQIVEGIITELEPMLKQSPLFSMIKIRVSDPDFPFHHWPEAKEKQSRITIDDKDEITYKIPKAKACSKPKDILKYIQETDTSSVIEKLLENSDILNSFMYYKK
jgi:hypothetical protein